MDWKPIDDNAKDGRLVMIGWKAAEGYYRAGWAIAYWGEPFIYHTPNPVYQEKEWVIIYLWRMPDIGSPIPPDLYRELPAPPAEGGEE